MNTPKRMNACLHFRFLERASIPLSPYFSSLTPTHNPPPHRSPYHGIGFIASLEGSYFPFMAKWDESYSNNVGIPLSPSACASYHRDFTLTNAFGSL
ncbi:hypothetical protein AVEN_271747-1 [Araneus ventricosus]|uniref:Uncharacterized protein n=1 Tax=Araneus ventricosus TaxID=182803 RepID=A0A4Y2W895_ARAVE|nr:hypothetical protein AVEN_271747-1 [Araneus ventricosus]